MARWLFPDDRLVFRHGLPGTPIFSPNQDTILIYLDEELTTLANIQDVNHVPIAGSFIRVGGDCMLPLFYGPENATSVWAKAVAGGDPFELYASSGDRLEVVETALGLGGGQAALVTSVNGVEPVGGNVTLTASNVGALTQAQGDVRYDPKGGTVQVHNQQNPSLAWLINHTFPNKPTVDVFDASGEPVETDILYPTTTSVRIEFASAMTGTATLR